MFLGNIALHASHRLRLAQRYYRREGLWKAAALSPRGLKAAAGRRLPQKWHSYLGHVCNGIPLCKSVQKSFKINVRGRQHGWCLHSLYKIHFRVLWEPASLCYWPMQTLQPQGMKRWRLPNCPLHECDSPRDQVAVTSTHPLWHVDFIASSCPLKAKQAAELAAGFALCAAAGSE